MTPHDSAVARVRDLGKTYGDFTALDGVSFELHENVIHGLLGRNGAGKSTIMRILTGQAFEDSGRVEVFGAHPYENDAVLGRICFVSESLKYPTIFATRHVLAAGRLLYPTWDEDFAARAPLTLFDEPYLGLDASARQLFYDRLLEDYAENPRTILLSTHLIDEVADLIEHVVLIDRGRVLIDEPAEALRGSAVTVSGPAEAIDRFVADREELHRERLGTVARVTVRGALSGTDREDARAAGIGLEPVSLQQLVVRTTGRHDRTASPAGDDRELSGDGAGASGAAKGASR
jgi:ABC-2 type transport system ATP-binding protein